MNENHDRSAQLFAGLLIWAFVVLTAPLVVMLGDYLGDYAWPAGYWNQIQLIVLSIFMVVCILGEFLLVLAGFFAFEKAFGE